MFIIYSSFGFTEPTVNEVKLAGVKEAFFSLVHTVFHNVVSQVAGLGMTPHALEQEIGEQGDGGGIDNLDTLHPGFIPVLAAVRGKYIPVCGV